MSRLCRHEGLYLLEAVYVVANRGYGEGWVQGGYDPPPQSLRSTIIIYYSSLQNILFSCTIDDM